MVVHSEINKSFSNEIIFNTCDVSMTDMENRYFLNLQCFKHDGGSENLTSFHNHLSELFRIKTPMFMLVLSEKHTKVIQSFQTLFFGVLVMT